MRYNEMKIETHNRILNASDNIDAYKNLIGLPYDKEQKEKWLNEFDYFETIEGMLNRFEGSAKRWLELLKTDGIDSKHKVIEEIEQLFKEIEV